MAKDYVITTDSCCDMPEDYYRENGIRYANLSFTMGGQTYDTMDSDVFYTRLRSGEISTTNQANVADHLEMFENAIENGKDILHISFSSALSGTYGSAVIASKEALEKHPGAQVSVIDSRCASMGQGLYLNYAIENRKNGMSLAENAAWLEENKLSFAHWFTVDDLNQLWRGGRVSKTAAVLGTILSIKPVLHVDDEGRLIPMEKVRGRQKSIEQLLEHMKATIIEPEGQTVFISHGGCLEEAQRLADLIRVSLPVGEIKINPVGPVIGSHSGAGTIALFFRAEHR